MLKTVSDSTGVSVKTSCGRSFWPRLKCRLDISGVRQRARDAGLEIHRIIDQSKRDGFGMFHRARIEHHGLFRHGGPGAADQ